MGKRVENKYTKFIDKGDNTYEVWNIIYDEKVGIIKKARMGQWMHWQLFGDDGVGSAMDV